MLCSSIVKQVMQELILQAAAGPQSLQSSQALQMAFQSGLKVGKLADWESRSEGLEPDGVCCEPELAVI